jgi:hypothetical protein
VPPWKNLRETSPASAKRRAVNIEIVIGDCQSRFRVLRSHLRVFGSSFRVFGSHLRVFGSSFRVFGSHLRVFGSYLRVFGSSFRVFGSHLRVFGSSFRVFGSHLRVFGSHTGSFRRQSVTGTKKSFKGAGKLGGGRVSLEGPARNLASARRRWRLTVASLHGGSRRLLLRCLRAGR